MLMPDRLLVPLDGSPRAAAVLFALDAWAVPTAEVLLLQVRPRPRHQRYDGHHVETIEHQCRAAEIMGLNYLECVGTLLQRHGWRLRPMVRLGEPATEILAVAEAEAVRAIVLTGPSPAGLPALWRGRLVQQVLARARVPVMVFHPGAGWARLPKVPCSSAWSLWRVVRGSVSV
jgi:nucleotide-binding universal stress UspA family protein